MRNDLAAVKYETQPTASADDEAGADHDAEFLSELIDKFAALTATAREKGQGRIRIPSSIVGLWSLVLTVQLKMAISS